MTSLSVNASVATAKTAVFNGKANLQDITNPLAPVSLGGNLTLQVTMTDRGEPGRNDQIGITVFNNAGGILYSSDWNGVRTGELILAGGNLVVNSGTQTFGGAQMSNEIVNTLQPMPRIQESIFNLTAFPNQLPPASTSNWKAQ
jgi:hypothetical protein